jgi:Flp pilus assembly protein TadG
MPSLLRKLKDDTGTALVEFALVVPLLLALLFGMVEFGRAFNYWLTNNHLANEAARLAATNRNPGGTTTAQLAQYLRGQIVSRELKDGTGSIQGKPRVCVRFLRDGAVTTTPQVGDAVEVRVEARFAWLPLLRKGIEGKGLGSPTSPIAGTSTMRIERVPTSYAAGCDG